MAKVTKVTAVLVHLSKVVPVTGYVLDESGHFDKSGIIRQFHRDLLLTGPVSVQPPLPFPTVHNLLDQT